MASRSQPYYLDVAHRDADNRDEGFAKAIDRFILGAGNAAEERRQ